MKRGVRQRTQARTLRVGRVISRRRCGATSASMARRADRRRWRKLDATASQRQLSEEPCPDAADVVADPSRRRDRCLVRFRDVLVGIVLRLLDWRMRPRRVRFRGIALYVPCCVRIDRRFDIRASVAAFACGRRLDGNFVPPDGPDVCMALSICQVANSRGYSRKRHAKGSRPAGVMAPGCLRRFYKRSVVYCNPDCNSCRAQQAAKQSPSSESDAGTRLATDRAQGVGNIGFVQPSHEPSSIHPAHLLHSSVAAPRQSCGTPRGEIRRALIGPVNAAVGALQPPRRQRGSNGRVHPL